MCNHGRRRPRLARGFVAPAWREAWLLLFLAWSWVSKPARKEPWKGPIIPLCIQDSSSGCPLCKYAAQQHSGYCAANSGNPTTFYIYIYIYIYLFMCVLHRERERVREREKQRAPIQVCRIAPTKPLQTSRVAS